jgi:hypothetical protein
MVLTESQLNELYYFAVEQYILDNGSTGNNYEIENVNGITSVVPSSWSYGFSIPTTEQLLALDYDTVNALRNKYVTCLRLQKTQICCVTTSVRDSIPPTEGHLIYNTSVGRLQIYTSSGWVTIANE